MKTVFKILRCILLLLLLSGTVPAEVLYDIDFSKAEGDVKTWLGKQGWKNKAAIMRMNPRFEDGALVIETEADYSGAFVLEFDNTINLSNATHVVIDWEVNQYPAGADWEGPVEKKRNTREAIAVLVLFGTETFDSGHTLAGEAPYYFGLFPSKTAETGKFYLGNYWQASGRYICVSGCGTTKPLITRYELPNNFQQIFGVPAPPISGIGIEVDAKNTKKINGYHTKARIRKITILDQEA